ncbi:hypothetical protein [Enterocloster clostridioformis]|jgi:hypothetical protein|nr:hypothetical protein [Enterocloster clostridioformis]
MKKLLSIRNQFLDLLYVDNGKPFARSRKKENRPLPLDRGRKPA